MNPVISLTLANGQQSVNSKKRTANQIMKYLIFRHFWGMDIAPTAWICSTAYIDRTNPRGIHIGQDCIIDSEAVILSHDMIRGLRVQTRIGDGSVIGTRAIIMPGVSVGKNCTVAPGSIVLSDVMDRTHVRGNSADVYEPMR